MATEKPRTVLVTGASGVVGRAVAEELRGHHLIGLVHADTESVGVDEVLFSDLASPRLGLDEQRWRELAERTDVIVHSGALTEWGQPRERYQAINVDGTRRVMELAQMAQAPVHFVSTCFVHALERGAQDQLGAGNVVRNYIASKLESEQLLAASDIPHSVYRPTNLVGDSRTGASSRPQIVQAMSDWICRGKAPYFPAHPGNRIDVAPLDALSITVARAVETDDLGKLYWITYGEEAMTVPRAIEVLVEHARRLGRDIGSTPVVDPSLPLPLPPERAPATSRVFLQTLIDVSEVTHACGGVLPSSLSEVRERFGVPVVTDTDAYHRSLQYWAAQRGSARQTQAMV